MGASEVRGLADVSLDDAQPKLKHRGTRGSFVL